MIFFTSKILRIGLELGGLESQHFLIKKITEIRQGIFSVKKNQKKMTGVLYGRVQEFWVRRCIIITTNYS